MTVYNQVVSDAKNVHCSYQNRCNDMIDSGNYSNDVSIDKEICSAVDKYITIIKV